MPALPLPAIESASSLMAALAPRIGAAPATLPRAAKDAAPPLADPDSAPRYCLPLLIPPHDSLAGAADPFLDDAAATLREWAAHINALLRTENYALYPPISAMFRSLSHARQTLRSQTLSPAETERCRRSMIQCIQAGNRILGLDTYLFDPGTGAMLSHATMPVVDLLAHHRAFAATGNPMLSSGPLHHLQHSQGPAADVIGAPGQSAAAGSTASASAPHVGPDPAGGAAASLGIGMPAAAGPAAGAARPDLDPSLLRFHIYMELKACVAPLCEAGETAELFFCIYDASSKRAISEEFLVRINSHGMPADDSLSAASAGAGTLLLPATVFADISSRDVQQSLLLACRVVRVSSSVIANAEPSFGSAFKFGRKFGGSSSNKVAADNGPAADESHMLSLVGHDSIRRVVGIAFLGIADLLKTAVDSNPVPKERSMQILIPATQQDADVLSFENYGQAELFQVMPRADGIALSLAAFDSGSQAYASRSGVFKNLAPSRRLGYFDSAWRMPSSGSTRQLPPSLTLLTAPNSPQSLPRNATQDHHQHRRQQHPAAQLTPQQFNSVYITMTEGSFASVRPSNGRAVQVSMQIRTSSGAATPGAIVLGVGDTPVDHFDSTVFANAGTPKWGETVRVDLAPEALKQAHLFFTFRVCTPASGEMSSERFAFAFLPLTKGQHAVINDAPHRLTLYKYDKRIAVPSIYLNYPAGPNIFVPAQLSTASVDSLAAAADAMAKVPVLKDTFTVTTTLFSTQMTQDTALLNLLDWRQQLLTSRASLAQILTEFSLLGEAEVLKFMPAILAELMHMLEETLDPHLASFPVGNASAIQRDVFETVIFVLTIGLDKRLARHVDAFSLFVSTRLDHPRVWAVLCEQLEQLFRTAPDPRHGKLLRKTIKVLNHIAALAVVCAELAFAEETPRAASLTRVASPIPSRAASPVPSLAQHAQPSHRPRVSEKCVDRMRALHEGLQYLVSLSEPDHVLASQALALQHFAAFAAVTSHVFDNDQTARLVTDFLNSIQTTKPKLRSGRLLLMRSLLARPEFAWFHRKLRVMAVEMVLDSLVPQNPTGRSTLPRFPNTPLLAPPPSFGDLAVSSGGAQGHSGHLAHTSPDGMPAIDMHDSEIVTNAISLLEEIMRQMQPTAGTTPGATTALSSSSSHSAHASASGTPVSTSGPSAISASASASGSTLLGATDRDAAAGTAVESEFDRRTWNNLFAVLFPVFLSLRGQSGGMRHSSHGGLGSIADRDHPVNDPPSPTTAAAVVARSQREVQDLGAVLLAMFGTLTKAELADVFDYRATAMGPASACRMMVQALYILRLLLRPDVFDPAWTTVAVVVARTAMHVLEACLSVLEPLSARAKIHSRGESLASSRHTSILQMPSGVEPLAHSALPAEAADGATQSHSSGSGVDAASLLTSALESCWSDLFEVTLHLIDAPLLRLENAGFQRARVVQRLDGDVRAAAGRLLVRTWDACSRSMPLALRANTMPPGFVGSLLDLTLGSHALLRNAAADVLLGILASEYAAHAHFRRIEGECFDHLHRCIETGRIGGAAGAHRSENVLDGLHSFGVSDSPFLDWQPTHPHDLFVIAALDARLADERNSKFVSLARSFLRAAGKFVKVLVSHKQAQAGDAEERVASTVRVLRFLKNARRRALFLKYLHELFDIHAASGNLVEAALTLKHHADLLHWREDIAVEPMPMLGFPNWQTEFERKEQILTQCIKLLERGGAWERAVELCTDLLAEYKYHIWDHTHLTSALRFQAALYDKMASEERCYPSYYRVAFYGRGFSRRVAGKQFIYRGGDWEKIGAFCERIQGMYPDARIVAKNGPVGTDVEDAEGKFLQVAAVTPVPDVRMWSPASEKRIASAAAGGSAGASVGGGMFGTIFWDLEARTSPLVSARHGSASADDDAGRGKYGSSAAAANTSIASIATAAPVNIPTTTTTTRTIGNSPIPLWLFEPELFVEEEEARRCALRAECAPPQLRAYYEHSEVNIFAFSRPIKRSDESPAGAASIANHPAREFLELWTEKTVLFSEDTFPCMSRRSRVCQVMTFEISPVENAIIAVRSKTRQLLGFEKKFRVHVDASGGGGSGGGGGSSGGSAGGTIGGSGGRLATRLSVESAQSAQSRASQGAQTSGTSAAAAGGAMASAAGGADSRAADQGVSTASAAAGASSGAAGSGAASSAPAAPAAQNVNPFTMALNGAVDAPVNGGIPMYKSAFLSDPPLALGFNTHKHRELLLTAIHEHVSRDLGCGQRVRIEILSDLMRRSR
nr:hypothetical protein HK105_007663 [Polyrhizophydium stewartii]